VPISETNAVSVVNEVAELVSDPSWLNSTDVDEVTTLLEKALTLSSSQEVFSAPSMFTEICLSAGCLFSYWTTSLK
jgi:hypothetical protein